jgi:hypothetical protein
MRARHDTAKQCPARAAAIEAGARRFRLALGIAALRVVIGHSCAPLAFAPCAILAVTG